MNDRYYQQGLLELEAYILNRYTRQCNELIDQLVNDYSYYRTRPDRLAFIELNLMRFNGRLALLDSPRYESRKAFCKAHLQSIVAKRKRLSADWYLSEGQAITDYITCQVLKEIINWLDRRLELHRPKEPKKVGQLPVGQSLMLTIIPAELIPRLSSVLGQYLTPESRSGFTQLLEGKPDCEPLVITNQVNRFIDAFDQLSKAGIIRENKQQIRDWLITHFLQQRESGTAVLKANSVWDYLSKLAKKPTHPIDILQAIGWDTA